jgi:16S rRNA C1402 N4-methylase RsmH
MSSLTRIVHWSQHLACEVLQPGDFAIDLTAGRGKDSLALLKKVGQAGQVVAFDLQKAALEQTEGLLSEHGFAVHAWPISRPVPKQPGVFLVQACHSMLAALQLHAARAVVANLGYLPGGDKALVTRPHTTLEALQASLAVLAIGGRMVVTVYPVHPGGASEGQAVESFFSALPAKHWQVLSLRVANCPEAPFLMAAERLS